MKPTAAKLAWTIALFAPFAVPSPPVWAQDQLKAAIGQINNWENQAPTLGQDAGIFKKHNLVLENFGTQGAGETMQPIISGSADIGAGVGDRKSTRLNSSHITISYAVFCLKKKKHNKRN